MQGETASLPLGRENWHPSWFTWRCPSHLQPRWRSATSMAWNTFCWLRGELRVHDKNVLFIRPLLVMSYYTNGSSCLEFDFKWHGSHILMKMRKTCFAIRNKDFTFSNSATCYILVIHPGGVTVHKVKDDGPNTAGIYCGCACFFPLGSFVITVLTWKTLFLNMNLWEYSNASLCACVFSRKKSWFDGCFLFYLYSEKVMIAGSCLSSR